MRRAVAVLLQFAVATAAAALAPSRAADVPADRHPATAERQEIGVFTAAADPRPTTERGPTNSTLLNPPTQSTRPTRPTPPTESAQPRLPTQPTKSPAPTKLPTDESEITEPPSPNPTPAKDPPRRRSVGEGLLQAMLVGAVGVALAAVAAFAVGRRRSGLRTSPSPLVVETTPAGAGNREAALVSGLIAVHDLANEEALRISVEETLRGVGVHTIIPVAGDPLDVGMHEVVGTLPATAPGVVGRIAGLVRPGWRHHEVLIRPAQVQVFRR